MGIEPQSEVYGEGHRVSARSPRRPVETDRYVGLDKIGFEEAALALDLPTLIQYGSKPELRGGRVI